MDFDNRYFTKFNFSREQIEKNLASALRDLTIAQESAILDVKFNYAYAALIKGGIDILGNVMRQKRNQDFYSGGIEVKEKECQEYLDFVGRVLRSLEKRIRRGSN
jgi:hypothetical protein